MTMNGNCTLRGKSGNDARQSSTLTLIKCKKNVPTNARDKQSHCYSTFRPGIMQLTLNARGVNSAVHELRKPNAFYDRFPILLFKNLDWLWFEMFLWLFYCKKISKLYLFLYQNWRFCFWFQEQCWLSMVQCKQLIQFPCNELTYRSPTSSLIFHGV